MALFPKFPYLNFHELNLNWIIEQVKTNKDNIEKTIKADYSFTKTDDGYECSADYEKLVEVFASGNPTEKTIEYCGATTTVAVLSNNQMIGKPISFSFILGSYPTSGNSTSLVIKTISVTVNNVISATTKYYTINEEV